MDNQLFFNRVFGTKLCESRFSLSFDTVHGIWKSHFETAEICNCKSNRDFQSFQRSGSALYSPFRFFWRFEKQIVKQKQVEKYRVLEFWSVNRAFFLRNRSFLFKNPSKFTTLKGVNISTISLF